MICQSPYHLFVFVAMPCQILSARRSPTLNLHHPIPQPKNSRTPIPPNPISPITLWFVGPHHKSRFICLHSNAMPCHLLSTQKPIAIHQSPITTPEPRLKKLQKPKSPESLNSPNHHMICRSPCKWRFICLRCNAMSGTFHTQTNQQSPNANH